MGDNFLAVVGKITLEVQNYTVTCHNRLILTVDTPQGKIACQNEIWIQQWMNPTAPGAKSNSKKYHCQSKRHVGCPMKKRTESATFGPIGSNERVYCTDCTRRLRLFKKFKSNANSCVVCEAKVGRGGNLVNLKLTVWTVQNYPAPSYGPPDFGRASNFEFECLNDKCAGKGHCQRLHHDKCDKIPCTKAATYGPGFERIYCRDCVKTLRLTPFYESNWPRCVKCGDGSRALPAMFGKRGGRKTHCLKCAAGEEGLISLRNAICAFKLLDGELCSRHATGRIDGVLACTEHGTSADQAAAGDFERFAYKVCQAEGCEIVATGTHCHKHLRELGLPLPDDSHCVLNLENARHAMLSRYCVDGKDTMESFRCKFGKLCAPRLHERQRCDDTLEFEDLTKMWCLECGVRRRKYGFEGGKDALCSPCAKKSEFADTLVHIYE
ncbi:hypothetical protein PHYSODRAFT_295460 [Phytophthora sojae]|uniref:Uncharacterized protein n=1 Tax=Phytophthora sojae (strain P6497) TaxID=1094619 RepID=G4YR64_PHYSP|nr:hypothetical protein PHYSODRAFT_295460 [Phytophthora sojae]EGZ22798.1 hypothetical protein PHYSODRAFT_295460 [Phytophthora sojae]|eukprot:XP_009518086.1 hypothetical protein PHYSODRAFT_295460 [Phytophthora sojae]